jgi:hypothetical protein
MARGSDPHWMEKAFANSHGQFKAKAKRAGESTKQFANEPHKGKTARQANLVKTVTKINRQRGR